MWKHGRCAKGSAECAEVRFGVWCLARRRRVANAGVRYDIAGPLRGAKRQTPNAQLQTPNPDHFNPHPCDGFIFSCVVKIKQHLMKNWALFFAEKYFSPSVRPWKIRAGTPGAKCPPVRESGSKNHREATWPANRVCRSDPGGTAAAGAGQAVELGVCGIHFQVGVNEGRHLLCADLEVAATFAQSSSFSSRSLSHCLIMLW